ncbi:hypothetical protein ACKI1Q_40990 [Streptomyces galilaeus]|uniref:hypothetical protein n=1 Tax=Streptomyces galilaeus TaxID=33899 RepID=UPI0038F772F2
MATFSTVSVTAESSCGPRPFTAFAARGGSPCDRSQAAMSEAAWLPSTRTSAAWVMRLTAAASIAGSEASGDTVAT